MKLKFSIGIVLLMTICGLEKAAAQNNNSPYSLLGLGDIEKSTFDRGTGMGHTGIALATDSVNRYLYHSNPAAFSGLQNEWFHVEIAARYKGVNYSGTPITSASANQSSDLQFKKLAIAMKLKPRWGVSVGLLPFSSSNYSFYSTKYLGGTNASYPVYKEGTGSVNQFYLTNSFKLSEKLSIGLQTSFLFGSLTRVETEETGIPDSTIATTNNIAVASFYFKGGVQYNTRITKRWSLFAGATASLKSPIKATSTVTTVDGNTVIKNTATTKNDYFNLPLMVAGGLAAKLDRKYVFAVDYNYQGWDGMSASGYQLVNSNKIAAGFEYKNNRSFRELYYEKYFLQAGAFYSNSYLKVYGQQINDYGITFGGGFNSAKSNLALSMSLEIGQRGTTKSGLIKENYTQFNLTVAYRDFWFVKVKRYD